MNVGQEASFLLDDQVLVEACHFENILQHLFRHSLGLCFIKQLTVLVHSEGQVEHLALDS